MVLKKFKYLFMSGILFLPVVVSAAPKKSFGHGGTNWLVGVLAFCGVILLVAIGYLSLCLVFSVLKPELLRRSEKYLTASFFKNFLTGLLVSIIYLLFLGTAFQVMPSQAIRAPFTVPVLGLFFLHGLIGFTMVAQGLGDKIHSNINSRYIGSTFMAVFAGGTVLILSGLIPFIGPICFLLVNLMGIGLATRTVMGIRREKKQQVHIADENEPTDLPKKNDLS